MDPTRPNYLSIEPNVDQLSEALSRVDLNAAKGTPQRLAEAANLPVPASSVSELFSRWNAQENAKTMGKPNLLNILPEESLKVLILSKVSKKDEIDTSLEEPSFVVLKALSIDGISSRSMEINQKLTAKWIEVQKLQIFKVASFIPGWFSFNSNCLTYGDFDGTKLTIDQLMLYTNLRHLKLPKQEQLGPNDFTKLAGNLTCLNSLDLSACYDMYNKGNLTNACLDVITEHFTHLTSLNLENCRDVTEISKIANKLTSLTSLNISSTCIANIESVSNLCNLTFLDMYFCSIKDIKADQICKLTNLISLGLANQKINDSDLGMIANSLSRLNTLNLAYYEGKGDLSVIFDRLTNLTKLDISRSKKITDSSVSNISKLVNLGWLDIGESNVTDSGLGAIGALNNLSSLYMKECQITDKGLGALAQLSNLGFLEVYGCKEFTLEGLSAFLGDCKNLTSIDVRSCDQLPEKDKHSIFTAFKSLKIHGPNHQVSYHDQGWW